MHETGWQAKRRIMVERKKLLQVESERLTGSGILRDLPRRLGMDHTEGGMSLREDVRLIELRVARGDGTGEGHTSLLILKLHQRIF